MSSNLPDQNRRPDEDTPAVAEGGEMAAPAGDDRGAHEAELAGKLPDQSRQPDAPGDDLDARELKRIRAKVRGFRHHASVYAAVIGGLFLINLFTSFGNWWFIYPAIGWGVGLAIHGMTALETGAGRRWEERMVADIAARRTGKTPPSRKAGPDKDLVAGAYADPAYKNDKPGSGASET